MSFTTFKIGYLVISIVCVFIVLWRSRGRNDVSILLFASFVFVALFFALYLDSGRDEIDNDFSEYIFRAITHVRGDLALTMSNAMLWCIVPFAIGINLSKKRHGTWLVAIFFLVITIIKTGFDHYFIIHQYPEVMVSHAFEWQYVLTSWLIIYGLLAILIIKGRKFLFFSANKKHS